MSPSREDLARDQQAWQTPQARSIAVPKRLPLVNHLQTRVVGSVLTKDARLINCYAEYDPEDRAYWVYKRVGLAPTPSFSAVSTVPNGCYTDSATGAFLYSFGATLRAVNPFNGVNASTTITGALGLLSFQSMIAGGESKVAVLPPGQNVIWVVGGLGSGPVFNSYILPLAAGNLTVPGLAVLDGTLYVMDVQGNIFGSAINDPTTWNALNVIEASSDADTGVALLKHLSYVVALKQYTTQVFYDAGNTTGSPLRPVPEAQLPFGCFNAYTVATIDNTALWLTYDNSVSPQVVQMDNLSAKVVSTPAVERILDEAGVSAGSTVINGQGGYGLYTSFYAMTLRHGGHRFYILTSLSLNITLVYDIDQKLWYIWTDSQGNYWPVASISYQGPGATSAGAVIPTAHYVQTSNTGEIFKLDDCYTYPTDYGTIVPMDIYTPNYDGGTTRRKYLRTMYIDGDKVPGFLQIRHSDDDFNTWSNFRSVDLSLKKPRLTRCGSFDRRRAYHFRYAAATGFRIRDVDLQMDIGTL